MCPNKIDVTLFQVRLRLFDIGASDGLASGEKAFPNVGALRGDRFAVGERTGDIPESEYEIS